MTHPQEGGTGGEVSEILFFSAKSKRHPSLIYSMQIIPVCLSIVARRKGVSATRRGGLNWTPISLLVGHPCKLFHSMFGRRVKSCHSAATTGSLGPRSEDYRSSDRICLDLGAPKLHIWAFERQRAYISRDEHWRYIATLSSGNLNPQPSATHSALGLGHRGSDRQLRCGLILSWLGKCSFRASLALSAQRYQSSYRISQIVIGQIS